MTEALRYLIIPTFLSTQLFGATPTNDAIEYLNQLREKAGLIKLQYDDELSKMATSHSKYQVSENIFSHYESNKNNPYYTGHSWEDRASYIGYPYSSIGENISWGNISDKDSIDGLFTAIYHRLNFLTFKMDRVGYGYDTMSDGRRIYTYDMAAKRPTTVEEVENKNPSFVLWPPKDFQEAQPAFFNNESPTPLYEECAPGGSSGNPISIKFNLAKSGEIVYDSFEFRDSNGNPLEIKMLDHGLHAKEFAFFPIKRLDWDTTYSALFKYKEDGEPKELSWSFKTKKTPYALLVLSATDKVYKVARGATYTLYIPPKSCQEPADGSISYDPTKIEVLNDESKSDRDIHDIKVIGRVGNSFSTNIDDKTYSFEIFTNEVKTLTFSDITATSVTLHWEHENGPNDTGYKIFRNGKLIYTASKDEREYTDSGLDPNTTYKYTVKVTDDRVQSYARGEFGNINLTPDYKIPDDAYFIDIRNAWEREVYGGYPKGSKLVTYEFRERHAADEPEDRSKRRLNPNFIKEIEELVNGNKDAHIILICATGGRTGEYGDFSKDSAAKLLSLNGFSYVEHIMGGIFGENGWLENDLPWIKL